MRLSTRSAKLMHVADLVESRQWGVRGGWRTIEKRRLRAVELRKGAGQMNRRPSMFIGSSTEGLDVAKALQLALDRTADVELWTQGVFDLSFSYLESLIKEVGRVDFAALVCRRS